MTVEKLVFLGIKGYVIALDRATGRRIWEKKLVGTDFVSLLMDGNHVLAGAQGEIFCLDAANGETLWHGTLKGYGLGLVSIATTSGSSNPSLAQAYTASAAETGTTAGK